GLEHMPKGITLAKAAMPIDRERRMVRHLVVEIEATEPAIGKVKLHFLAQPALRTDAVAVADNQHPDHEFGVDRRPADLAVEGPQLLAKVSHYPRHQRIDAAKKMVPRNTTFEVEEIEQLALIDILPAHHDPPPLPRTSGRRNHDSSTTTSDFFNSIGQKRRSQQHSRESALPLLNGNPRLRSSLPRSAQQRLCAVRDPPVSALPRIGRGSLPHY